MHSTVHIVHLQTLLFWILVSGVQVEKGGYGLAASGINGVSIPEEDIQ